MKTMENDWIERHGGECPVPPETRVDVIYRFGNSENNLAKNIDWYFSSNADEVVRYRVREHAQPVEDAPVTGDEQRVWDLFAAAALQGMLACPGDEKDTHENWSKDAAKYADALILERAKRMKGER